MFVSVILFSIITFMINREKLTSKYRMVMVKNKALGKYVNDTLKKIDSLCQQNDNCNTYIRGEVKEKTRLRPPQKKVKPKKIKPKPPPKVKPKLKNNIKEITDFKVLDFS